MLKTEKLLQVDSYRHVLSLSHDPRERFKQLETKAKIFNITNGILPDYVTNSVFENGAVVLASDNIAEIWAGKAYKGKELLYSSALGFLIPKSSSLKARSSDKTS